jgi:hypothetical protein
MNLKWYEVSENDIRYKRYGVTFLKPGLPLYKYLIPLLIIRKPT